MIPVQPFTALFFCERHRCDMPHIVQFMSYDKESHIVNFMATCEECDEELQHVEAIVGFTASLPVREWDKITPEVDNPIFN